MAEFVIIGGGVYGAATAWELARRGGEVHLLEKGRIAGRASGGPGRRGVRANGRDHRELPLMRLAYDVWPTLHERLGAAPFYERTGQLLLNETEEDEAKARARLALQQRVGVESFWLERAALEAIEPRFDPAIRSAIHCPLDGVADHAAATRAYAAAAESAGARIEEGVAVKRIERAGGRAVAVVAGDERRIPVGSAVLLMANAGVASLLGEAVSLPVWNAVFQALVTAPLGAPPPAILIGHASRTVSLKAEGGDRLMISGGWPGLWDAATEKGTAIPASVMGNLSQAKAVLPALADMTVEIADADHQESMTLDDIPVIDRAPDAENLFYGVGWSGHGWAIAPVVAPLMAEWAKGGARPALLAPFSADRFAASAAGAG